jgi:hypothetical protein
MLSNTLVTNEVKNAAGTEQEFLRVGSEGRATEFRVSGETPSRPHRLKVSHQEVGSGINRRRRSRIGFFKDVNGDVTDSVASVQAYIVLDSPVGNLDSNTEPTNVLANLISFVASLGASTTILYDGTGTGAVCLLNGDI